MKAVVFKLLYHSEAAVSRPSQNTLNIYAPYLRKSLQNWFHIDKTVYKFFNFRSQKVTIPCLLCLLALHYCTLEVEYDA